MDPDRVHAALPMAGHKGFGLGLFIELLCGALVGMDTADTTRMRPHEQDRGAAILVIDPSATVGADVFERDTERLLATIRSSASRTSESHSGVTLPGDRSSGLRRERLDKGSVDIDEALWKAVRRATAD